MRLALCLLFLIACAGAPVAPTPAACPTCPQCPEATCPTCPDCPACAECPKPPEPVAADWYCTQITSKKTGTARTYCYLSVAVCERYREIGEADKNYGTPTPCVPQRTAFCFARSDYMAHNRQLACTATAEDCEALRKRYDEEPRTPTTKTSKCEPRLNTDSHTYDDAGEPVYYKP